MMASCGNCSGDCGHCGGCGASLALNAGELEMLARLGQIPFLPVAAAAADPSPIFLGDSGLTTEENSLILQCLEKKGLIRIDPDLPIKGFDGYGSFPRKGSAALTQRGQQVLEILEIQGITE